MIYIFNFLISIESLPYSSSYLSGDLSLVYSWSFLFSIDS